MAREPRKLDVLRKEQQLRLDAVLAKLASLMIVTRIKVRAGAIGVAAVDAPEPGTIIKLPVDRKQLQMIVRRAEELKEGANLPARSPAGLSEFVATMAKQHDQLHRIVGDEDPPICNPLGTVNTCGSPFAGVAEHFEACRRIAIACGLKEIFAEAGIGRLHGPALENQSGEVRRIEGIGSLAAALVDLVISDN